MPVPYTLELHYNPDGVETRLWVRTNDLRDTVWQLQSRLDRDNLVDSLRQARREAARLLNTEPTQIKLSDELTLLLTEEEHRVFKNSI
jgi:hypothetical protein